MDSYVITGKLHDDEWFCSIFKHEKLMNSTRPGLAFHDNRLVNWPNVSNVSNVNLEFDVDGDDESVGVKQKGAKGNALDEALELLGDVVERL